MKLPKNNDALAEWSLWFCFRKQKMP
jgi:hypothetical protein